MNAPSSTIKAAGGYGLAVAALMIALAVFAPEHYDRMPPGAGETLTAIAASVGGYFKKETVIK